MPVTQAKSARSKKELHESVLEKLHHAVSDFGHMMHEIKFKRLVSKAARIISDGLHGGKSAAKKSVAKKVVKKKAVVTAKKAVARKTATAKPIAKKALKKSLPAAATAQKKTAGKK
jgi:hypothetical protein